MRWKGFVMIKIRLPMKWKEKTKIGYALCAGFLIMACSPKLKTSLVPGISSQILDYNAEVYVYTAKDVLPKNLQKIGQTSITSSSFTQKCTTENLLEKAKEEARVLGANVLHISKLASPNFWVPCHRLEVALYRGANERISEQYKVLKEHPNPLADKVYALLHVYRFDSPYGLLNYDLKLGDSILCRVKNNFKTTLKITKEGLNSLSAKTETEMILPFEVVFGKEYYLRCSVKMGAFVGRPMIEFAPNEIGAIEFEAFKAK